MKDAARARADESATRGAHESSLMKPAKPPLFVSR
jgi:hypothetical protein